MTVETQPRLWHPFSQMPAAASRELVLVRGEGVWVFDRDEQGYLDATAGLWYCNVGHGRAELADAAYRQMLSLAGYQTFDVFANEPALELASRLSQIAPLAQPNAVFLTSGGSDSVDTAAKMVRRYWHLRGQPRRTVIVARGGAYHGMHAYGTSLAGIEANATGWGTIVPDIMHVAPHDAVALGELLERHGDRVGAFIGEPIIGAGGVHPPVDDYWPTVGALCRAHGVLLIADEVVTGFGRTGQWFASQRYGIEPDIVTVAKGITSGYLPLGAVLAGPNLLQVLWGEDAPRFAHGYTYSGHPTACAVALQNLAILEREQLADRVREREPLLRATVDALAEHPLIGEARCAGLLAAVELDAAALAADPALTERVVVAARQRGLLVRGLVGRSLQISPPLIIDDGEIAAIGERLREALDDVAREHAGG
jgi:putrescine aminotransferase